MLKMNNIIDALKNNNLVIMPSDTVYGIFADATNIDAIKKVDEAKGSNKPHLIVVSSIDMLKKYVSDISDLQKELIDKYWPNTLTILFKKNELISDELTKGSEFIGVRMPDNKFLLEVIESFGKPLISSSANISGEEVITNISQIDERLKKHVSFVYDGGVLNDIASTLVKIENNKIVFLREGKLAPRIKSDFEKYI